MATSESNGIIGKVVHMIGMSKRSKLSASGSADSENDLLRDFAGHASLIVKLAKMAEAQVEVERLGHGPVPTKTVDLRTIAQNSVKSS